MDENQTYMKGQDLSIGDFRVHLVHEGERYGATGSLVYGDAVGNGYPNIGKRVNDCQLYGHGLPLVEFYDMSQDPAKFPDGQFVARYYASTLLGLDHTADPIATHAMLSLDGGFPKWTLDADQCAIVGGWLHEMATVETDSVRDWYVLSYPTDELGPEISPDITFDKALDAVPLGPDFYTVLGAGDSIVRERVFEQLSSRYGFDYGQVYDSWLSGKPLAPEKVAVGVGYCFNLVPAREASDIDLHETTTTVTVDGTDYKLMKAATFAESQKVDALLDRYGDKRISDFRKPDTSRPVNLKNEAETARQAASELETRPDNEPRGANAMEEH